VHGNYRKVLRNSMSNTVCLTIAGTSLLDWERFKFRTLQDSFEPDSMVPLDLYPYPDLHFGSGSRRAKMTHKNRKKLIISFFKVLNVLL
jgi:hypothetical protein